MPISFFRNFLTKLSSFLFEGFVFNKKLLLSKLTIFLFTIFSSKSNKLPNFWHLNNFNFLLKLEIGSKLQISLITAIKKYGSILLSL